MLPSAEAPTSLLLPKKEKKREEEEKEEEEDISAAVLQGQDLQASYVAPTVRRVASG